MDEFKFDPQTLDRWLNDLRPGDHSRAASLDDVDEADFRELFEKVHRALLDYRCEHNNLLELHERLHTEPPDPDNIKELTARTANVVRALWQVIMAHRNLAHRKDETLMRALDTINDRLSRLERRC